MHRTCCARPRTRCSRRSSKAFGRRDQAADGPAGRGDGSQQGLGELRQSQQALRDRLNKFLDDLRNSGSGQGRTAVLGGLDPATGELEGQNIG